MEFTRDKFNGIIVEPASLPNDPQALRDAVDALVTLIENERLALAWVTLPISNAQSIPIFTAAGFSFHSCLTDQLTLVRCPFEQAFVPFIPTHTVGAGAIVINDRGTPCREGARHPRVQAAGRACRQRRTNSGFDRA
ncbi:Hydrolase, NUDIX family [Pseudomonas amygdali pv. hibisci]|uniref:Hydrolase, NUDIX family n=1 Tax=Pseudomonas amygdali pv. hibisci TaxID=251723 RepID=A0AB34UBU9_PSEA0|nr:Hydrolase, NUDIX family [Pseudomonas amygdali pv. hibisci]